MSCEHLICAQCAGPVSEGGCPVCRAARAQVHHHGGHGAMLPLAATTILVLLLLMIAAMHLH